MTYQHNNAQPLRNQIDRDELAAEFLGLCGIYNPGPDEIASAQAILASALTHIELYFSRTKIPFANAVDLLQLAELLGWREGEEVIFTDVSINPETVQRIMDDAREQQRIGALTIPKKKKNNVNQ